MATIAIQLTQNNKPIKTTVTPLHGGGFRVEATFTAVSKQPKLCLAPNDTSKQYTFAEANLNRGIKALDYVKPETTETVIKELFDNLNQIKLDFKNADEGLTHKINLTAEGLTALLTKQGNDLSKQIHSIRSTADFYERVLGTTENNVASNLSRMVQASGVIQTEVMKKIDPLSTKVTQTADSWAVKNLNSSGDVLAELNQTSGITKIKNNLIQLDGDTVMTNAFARNLLVDKLNAEDVSAFSAKFNKAIANQLDVNYLTGNFARFIQAIFNGKYSKVKIDGGGMQVLRNDGSYSTAFTDNGIDIFRGADKVGAIQSIDAPDIDGYFKGRKSISITAQPESYLSLDYATIDGKINSALTLGSDGRMRAHSPFYAGDTNNGFEINVSTVSTLKSASTVVTVDDVIWEGEAPVDVSAGLQVYNAFGWDKARRAKYIEVDGIRFTIKSLSQAIGNYIQFNVEEEMSGYPSSKPKVRLLGEPIKQDKEGEYETIKGSGFRDVNTAGGFVINSNRDMWVSTSGQQQWISITQLQRDLQALKNSVDSLSKSSGGTGWNGRGYEPDPGGAPYYKDTDSTGGKENVTTEKVKSIRVGDYVRIRSGVTHYYNDGGAYLKISPGYESKTYTVGQIVSGRSGTHLLMIGSTRIAWINSSDIYKV